MIETTLYIFLSLFGLTNRVQQSHIETLYLVNLVGKLSSQYGGDHLG